MLTSSPASPTWSELDVVCMERALKLAERGRGQVSPNPPVGCVLVREGRIIAEGWHDHLGDLHAEQAAIADAEAKGEPTEGSTAYVTLEPCNHFGLTPPCTQALLWAGVGEVIVATRDPNPTVRGQGIEVLLEAGLVVREGLLQDAARRQMQSFMHWCKTRRPIVTLKVAMDVNGIVDAAEGEAERFTSEQSLDAAHRLRRCADAIIVGVNTIIQDNPQLDVRRVELSQGNNPLRVVLDRTLRIPVDSQVMSDGNPTLIVHAGPNESDAFAHSKNISTVALPDGSGGADLTALLDPLGDKGVQEVLIEGGPHVWQQFLNEGLVDRAIIIHSPVTLGEGLHAGIDTVSLSQLEQVGTIDWGGDSVDLWTRTEMQWPDNNWP
jgi:diaminohydroxyphosphoribosylaminopyrimidine deaminase/5-amino-6-(5-phosphoribosylamino)uracil reductase